MNNTYYQEKIETLPENLGYAVRMSGWKEALVEIQNKFKLHIDQTQVLEDSTIRLMFGDIDAPDFINHMFSEAHINSETAADILLEVDLKILKKIRQSMEKIELEDQTAAELQSALLDDEEKEAREESEIFADFYEEVEKINAETEDELLSQGIKEDGSNITDEMLGEITEIPADIHQEKNDLLEEINTPSKSFTIPTTPKPEIKTEPIPVDHQLQNTHIEEPFHEEDIIPETVPVETKPQPTPEPVKVEQVAEQKPEIKKPININLNDIYREPIE